MDSSYNGNEGGPVISDHHGSSESRYSVGFPLGTALLLLLIFSFSAIFSCCYHWDKLRRYFFRRAIAHDPHHLGVTGLSSLPKPHHNMNLKQRENHVIMMPGDNVPKFIAVPSPCLPPRLEKVTVKQQPQPPPPQPVIVKPLHIPILRT